MDTYSNNKTKPDLVRLEEEVRRKASEYLDDITEDNLRAFAESTKIIAQSVLEAFYFSVNDLYTDGAKKISDPDKLIRFDDFHDGYCAKMREWANQNEILIREMKIMPADDVPQKRNEPIYKAPLIIAGVGTLVAVGLCILTEKWPFPEKWALTNQWARYGKWVALAAELLALGTAAFLYKKKKGLSESEYNFKLKQYEIQIEKERARLVNGLIKDLKTWLENAKAYSEELLATYEII